MSLRVLFTHSFFLALDRKQRRTAKPYPPLATLYAAAAARAAGHEVSLFDATWAPSAHALEPELAAKRPDVLVVYDDSFNWLTKMCLAVMERQALAMVEAAKRRGLRVIVSGSDATDHEQRYLRAGADAVLVGEGEGTLVDALAAIERGAPLSGIPGVSTLEGGAPAAIRRESSRDIDIFPRPDWGLVDLSPYERTWRRRHGYFSLNLVSSRGCSYGCSWCAKPLFGRQYVAHGASRIVEEVATVRRLGAEHVWFGDDIFGLTEEWAGEFADGVVASGVRTPFMIQTRADLMVKHGLRRNLVRAGLQTAWLGAESGSQAVLDAMTKGLRVEDTYEAVRLLRADGVKVGMFLQYGYLGETDEDVAKTIKMVTDLMPDDLGISVSYPLPGTPFHEQVLALVAGRGAARTKTNWQDSDDLDLMYPGAHRPAYYRSLHSYTHRVYRTRRGIDALRALARAPMSATRRQLRSAAATFVNAPAAAAGALSLWMARSQG